MNTAYDLMNRIILLDEYIESVKSGHLSISNYNEDLGEGNPKAIVLNELIEELKKERKQHLETLKNMELNKL